MGSNALPLTKFVKSRRCSTRIDSCLEFSFILNFLMKNSPPARA